MPRSRQNRVRLRSPRRDAPSLVEARGLLRAQDIPLISHIHQALDKNVYIPIAPLTESAIGVAICGMLWALNDDEEALFVRVRGGFWPACCCPNPDQRSLLETLYPDNQLIVVPIVYLERAAHLLREIDAPFTS